MPRKNPKEKGLSSAQLEVLRYLNLGNWQMVYWVFKAGEVGQAHACLTRTDAFATLQHTRTILPKTARYLLDEGYVEPQPSDKREPPQCFRLSAKGREALPTARPVPDNQD